MHLVEELLHVFFLILSGHSRITQNDFHFTPLIHFCKSLIHLDWSAFLSVHFLLLPLFSPPQVRLFWIFVLSIVSHLCLSVISNIWSTSLICFTYSLRPVNMVEFIRICLWFKFALQLVNMSVFSLTFRWSYRDSSDCLPKLMLRDLALFTALKSILVNFTERVDLIQNKSQQEFSV